MQKRHRFKNALGNPDRIAFVERHSRRNPAGIFIGAVDLRFFAVVGFDAFRVDDSFPDHIRPDRNFHRREILAGCFDIDRALAVHAADLVQIKAADIAHVSVGGRVRVLFGRPDPAGKRFKQIAVKIPRRCRPAAFIQTVAAHAVGFRKLDVAGLFAAVRANSLPQKIALAPELKTVVGNQGAAD